MNQHQPPRRPAAQEESQVSALVSKVVDDVGKAVDGLVGELQRLEGTDPQAGFELAERLHAGLTAAAGRVITVRDNLIVTIWKREELSLAQLANRIGRHKSRADQITRAVLARQNREGSSDGS